MNRRATHCSPPRSEAVSQLIFLAVLVAPLSAALAAEVDMSLLAGLEARSIGPAGMSGRVAAIDAVVADPKIVYVGAATGGVWKSTDSGVTWRPIFDDQPVASIGAVAIFQANPDVVWVGTGEGNPRNSTSVGNGVYRSLDGGESWSHLGLEESEHVHRVRLHPADPDVAYVCALGQVWGENEQRGVFRTDDGGETWEKVLYVDDKTGCGDLAMDPSNPDRLIASMWQFRRWPYHFRSGGPGSGIYHTVDGGKNWQRYGEMDGMPKGQLGRAGIAFARSDPRVVYALVEARASALLRSEDGGRSWSSVNTDPDIAPRPFYFCDLRVDPELPNRVYSLHGSIDVSEDGGRTFRTLAGFGALHPDHHELWIHPHDGEHLLAGNDGGVGISRDRGSSWRFVRNLPLAQYYHVRVDMETPYNVYGGLQDNGSWRGPSAVWESGFGGGIRNFHWTMVAFGDGFDTAPDPESPMRGYAMSQGGNLSRWNLGDGGGKSIRPDGPDDEELRFNWNAGFAQDPFDAATIYYGSQFVHRSRDRGETWARISPDLTSDEEEWQLQSESGGLTLDVTAAENYTTILAIAPSSLEPGVLWVGTDDGRVHVTRDGGEAWSSLEEGAAEVPKNTWVPHITPSKFRADEAFVVFDNHRRSDWTPYVYRVSDYGRRWRKLGADGVEGYALKVEQDPVKEDLLFLGTEFGLWVSFDGGEQWSKWTHGVPTVSVMDMVIHPREHDLVLGTHGRAIYVLDDLRPLREISVEVLDKPLHLFATADAQQHQRGSSPGELMPGSGEFRGENRPYGALITFSLNGESLPHPDPDVEREREEKRRLERPPGGQEEEDEPEESAARPRRRGRGGPPGRGPGGRSAGTDGPQATIEIHDGAGEKVRSFERAVKLGVNRVIWDLRRDGFRRPGGGGGFGPFGGGGGPEVVPGEYRVTVRFAEQEAEGSVRVAADPRLEISLEDREANLAAIAQAGELQEAIADAVERIESVRGDLEVVTRKVSELQSEEDSEEEESSRESVDEGPLSQIEERAGDLQKALTGIEEKLWTPPGTKGIVARDRALDRVRRAMGGLQSTWEAPNPTHLTYLRQARQHLEPILAELNELLEGDVADLRSAVREAGIELLGGAASIEMQ